MASPPEPPQDQAEPGTTPDGIDTTLIDEMLAMTPEERLRTHDAALRCALDLREAMGVSTDDPAP